MNRGSLNCTAAFCLAALAVPLASCDDPLPIATALLSTPRGIAQAGDLLFVTNSGEDTLQVARLSDDFTQIAFLRSEALYFSLRIPAGPNPEAVAATPAGDFVVVLSRTASQLSLIDTLALAPAQDENGGPVTLSLGGAVTGAFDLVSSGTVCDSPCAGRFLVSLPDAGSILQVEVRVAETPTLVVSAEFGVGGAPGRLLTDATGRFIFTADIHAPEVRRFDTATQAVDVLPVGELPGPMALSQNGDVLVVGRSASRDVVVFQGASAAPVRVAADSPFQSAPACFRSCSDDASTCSGASIPDQAVCVDSAGDVVASGEPTYDGFYLGTLPEQMVMLERVVGDEKFALPCGDDNKRYAMVVAVASLDGAVRFVGLQTLEDAPVEPALLSYGYCEDTTVEPLADAAALDSFLQECPAVPSSARYAQLPPEDDETPGSDCRVVVFPGQTGSQNWRFDWEGVLSGLDRGTGGGELQQGGNLFTDLGLDFNDYDVRTEVANGIGDTLDIVTEPRDTAACREALLEDTRRCRLERRIVDIERQNSNQSALVLDAPIPTECFSEGGAIGYQIRASGEYTVSAGGDFVTRFSPAQVRDFGPHGSFARQFNLMFRTRVQDTRVGSLGSPENIDACERYDESYLAKATSDLDDEALATLQALQSRSFPPYVQTSDDRRFGFRVTDPFSVVRAGLDFGGETPTAVIGRVPGDMEYISINGRGLVVLSYAGSNSLLIFDPFRPKDFATEYLILR